MNDKWKDIFIIITLGTIAVLAGITVVDLFLIRTLKLNSGITIGFIGAILGGSLSGVITLIGVKKTIQDSRERDRRKEYIGNLGERSLVKYDVVEELKSMKYDLSAYMKNIDDGDSDFDQAIIKFLYDIQNRSDKLIRDGIRVGEDNIETFRSLTNVVGALIEEYYSNIDEEYDFEDETTYLLTVYSKDEILQQLDNAIDTCFKNAQRLKKELFDEVFRLSQKPNPND